MTSYCNELADGHCNPDSRRQSGAIGSWLSGAKSATEKQA
jgi:hypothetical protein